MEITADQDHGQDYKTLQDQDQNRRCRICDKQQQVVQLNFVKVTSTCRYHRMVQ